MALAPPDNVLASTPVFRMVHIDCLGTLLQRGALHAPSCVPHDGLPYTGIHAPQTQVDRGGRPVPCGPRGIIRNYVGFYFGPRSPMLYRIQTGWNVAKVDQENIIYLVSTAQALAGAGLRFVYTDRHSLAAVACFRDSLDDLSIVDYAVAYATQWNTTAEHPDRQEKKQAEFLVYQAVPWELVGEIGVLNEAAEKRVASILDGYPGARHPQVLPRPSWYY